MMRPIICVLESSYFIRLLPSVMIRQAGPEEESDDHQGLVFDKIIGFLALLTNVPCQCRRTFPDSPPKREVLISAMRLACIDLRFPLATIQQNKPHAIDDGIFSGSQSELMRLPENTDRWPRYI